VPLYRLASLKLSDGMKLNFYELRLPVPNSEYLGGLSPTTHAGVPRTTTSMDLKSLLR
jgi:hypothetical protein